MIIIIVSHYAVYFSPFRLSFLPFLSSLVSPLCCSQFFSLCLAQRTTSMVFHITFHSLQFTFRVNCCEFIDRLFWNRVKKQQLSTHISCAIVFLQSFPVFQSRMKLGLAGNKPSSLPSFSSRNNAVILITLQTGTNYRCF